MNQESINNININDKIQKQDVLLRILINISLNFVDASFQIIHIIFD